MTAVASTASQVGRLTRADLDAMPDDGRRYELLDGAIIVSPSPGGPHQVVVTNLILLLRAAELPGLQALVGPYDVDLPDGNTLVPDLVVARREQVKAHLEGLPMLAVEVISPSSRRRDLGDKLTAYRDAGVPSYWMIDPTTARLQAWTLRDGEYVEIADVTGDEEFTTDAPYPITLRPIDLTR